MRRHRLLPWYDGAMSCLGVHFAIGAKEAQRLLSAADAELVANGGLEAAPGVTFLVGESRSGKSTLLEAFAGTYSRGGHEPPAAHVAGPTPSPENSPP